MKAIILNKTAKNWEKLQDELDRVEKNCRVRRLNTTQIKDIIKEITILLQDRRLPKNSWEGLIINCNPYADYYPGSYKYNPFATSIRLIYSKGSFRVTNISRVNCEDNPKKAIKFTFTDDQKNKIIDNLSFDKLDNFTL